jgi:hypothetical protein
MSSEEPRMDAFNKAMDGIRSELIGNLLNGFESKNAERYLLMEEEEQWWHSPLGIAAHFLYWHCHEMAGAVYMDFAMQGGDADLRVASELRSIEIGKFVRTGNAVCHEHRNCPEDCKAWDFLAVVNQSWPTQEARAKQWGT